MTHTVACCVRDTLRRTYPVALSCKPKVGSTYASTLANSATCKSRSHRLRNPPGVTFLGNKQGYRATLLGSRTYLTRFLITACVVKVP